MKLIANTSALVALAFFAVFGHCADNCNITTIFLDDDEVTVLADFFAAVHYENHTPVTPQTACVNWPNRVKCCDANHISDLTFADQSLDGTLPESLSRLRYLRSFDVTNNILSGTVPSSLSNWTKIQEVRLSENFFSGTLPSELHRWSSINTFLVEQNYFSGTLPASYAAWGAAIVWLSVFHNNLTGTLPQEYGSNFTNILTLDVSRNAFTGTLPASFSKMKTLKELHMSLNRFTGSLPPIYGRLANLSIFEAQGNDITGTFPPEYGTGWRAVRNFVVDSCRICGTLPAAYANWTHIESFQVHNNVLTGSLPPEWSSWTTITRFTVRNNSLNGTLPSSYAEWTMLITMDASNNTLTGNLPPSYAQWSTVVQMQLQNNQLSGTIPANWGMPNLASFNVGNNMLSGELPSTSFTGISLLVLSRNNFSGTFPATAWRNITILDAQNNTQLLGPPPLRQQQLLLVGVCGTQLCSGTSSPPSLPTIYTCLPPGSVDSLNYSDFGTLYSLAFTNSFALPQCSTPSPQHGITPSPPQNTTTPSPVSVAPSQMLPGAAAATTTFAAAAAAVSAVMGVDAADAQFLVSILESPCTCSAATASQNESLLLLALSPFSSLGPSWTAIGNSLLCCALLLLHVACVRVRDVRERSEHAHGRQTTRTGGTTARSTLLRLWLSGGRWRQQVIAQLRFPNLSVSLTLLLIPGVVRALTSVFSELAQSTNNNAATALNGVAAAVGVVFVLCGAVAVELLVYRHIIVASANVNGQKAQLRYEMHRHIEKTFAPVPVRVANVALPQGHWVPESAVRSYGGVVTPYRIEWRRAWCVVVVVNLLVQVLSAIDGNDVGCNALQSLTMIILAAASVFFAVVRPHRALLASYLTCVSLLLSCVVTLMAMLCRLGSVDRSAVDGFGVFASAAMMVMKAYTIGHFYVEVWLLKLNRDPKWQRRFPERILLMSFESAHRDTTFPVSSFDEHASIFYNMNERCELPARDPHCAIVGREPMRSELALRMLVEMITRRDASA